MKLTLVRKAVEALSIEVREKILRKMGKGDFHVLDLRAKQAKLDDVWGLLREGRPLVELEPYARFLAFVALTQIRLPGDTKGPPTSIEELTQYQQELAYLGYDMFTLSVRSVYEEPITGADFK